MKYYVNNFVRKVKEYFFKRKLNEVLSTSPLYVSKDSKIIVVSLVHKSALTMALAALKSFLFHMPNSRLELLDDGSLEEFDYSLLYEHFPQCNITKISDISRKGCPAGGCWERLLRIQELTSEGYVIQVDTDTLTISDIPEVINCVNENRAFTIGGPEWPKPVPIDEIVSFAKSISNNHIQIVSERALEHVKSIPIYEYTRACAAFTGFPHQSNLADYLFAFSSEMEQLLGERWLEWGTEQFSSNVLVSLCPNPLVLPWPKYQNYGFPFDQSLVDKPVINGDVSVVHFIGTNRYSKGVYSKLIPIVIDLLKKENSRYH